MKLRSAGDVRSWFAIAAIGANATFAHAQVVEEQVDLPVQVADAYDKQVAQPIKVTVFHDDAAVARRPAIGAVIDRDRARRHGKPEREQSYVGVSRP